MSARNRTYCFLSGMNLLLRKPSGIFDGLLNVLLLQVGVTLKDLLKVSPVSDLTNNHRNRDTHSTYARPAAHDLGIKRNSIKHITFHPFAQRPARQILFLSIQRLWLIDQTPQTVSQYKLGQLCNAERTAKHLVF